MHNAPPSLCPSQRDTVGISTPLSMQIVVNQRTELANEIKSQLKLYFPVALKVLENDITTALATDLLVQWPTLAELQKVSPSKLRKFFYGHNSRHENKIRRSIDWRRQCGCGLRPLGSQVSSDSLPV